MERLERKKKENGTPGANVTPKADVESEANITPEAEEDPSDLELIFETTPNPIHYSACSVSEGEDSHLPDTEWFCLEMEDPAQPNFCSMGKDYFGSKERIREYQEKCGEDHNPLTPCRLLKARTIWFNDVSWEHINFWDSTRQLKADSIKVEQVLLECGGWYYLAIRPVFHGMRHYRPYLDLWVPMPELFWGNQGVMSKKDDDIVANLFVTQMMFDNQKIAGEWMRDVDRIRFYSVCEEIFGNG